DEIENLPAAFAQIGAQRRGYSGWPERKDRMFPAAGTCNGDSLRIVACRVRQPGCEIAWQEGRIAGHGHERSMRGLGFDPFQPGQYARQWAGKSGYRIRQNRQAECGEAVEVAVGVEGQRG